MPGYINSTAFKYFIPTTILKVSWFQNANDASLQVNLLKRLTGRNKIWLVKFTYCIAEDAARSRKAKNIKSQRGICIFLHEYVRFGKSRKRLNAAGLLIHTAIEKNLLVKQWYSHKKSPYYGNANA